MDPGLPHSLSFWIKTLNSFIPLSLFLDCGTTIIVYNSWLKSSTISLVDPLVLQRSCSSRLRMLQPLFASCTESPWMVNHLFDNCFCCQLGSSKAGDTTLVFTFGIQLLHYDVVKIGQPMKISYAPMPQTSRGPDRRPNQRDAAGSSNNKRDVFSRLGSRYKTIFFFDFRDFNKNTGRSVLVD